MVVDFSDLRREKPPISVIHFWLKDNVKIPINVIEGIQVENETSTVYIKIINKEEYNKCTEWICGDHDFKDNKDKIWKIPIREMEETTYVRVLNIPFEVKMEDVEQILSEYGNILSSKFERWGRGYAFPVKSGVRAFKMELKKQIPSEIKVWVKYENANIAILAKVLYTGQTRTCRVCKLPGHFARNCVNKTSNAVYRAELYWNLPEQGQIPRTEADFPPLVPPIVIPLRPPPPILPPIPLPLPPVTFVNKPLSPEIASASDITTNLDGSTSQINTTETSAQNKIPKQ